MAVDVAVITLSMEQAVAKFMPIESNAYKGLLTLKVLWAPHRKAATTLVFIVTLLVEAL